MIDSLQTISEIMIKNILIALLLQFVINIKQIFILELTHKAKKQKK